MPLIRQRPLSIGPCAPLRRWRGACPSARRRRAVADAKRHQPPDPGPGGRDWLHPLPARHAQGRAQHRRRHPAARRRRRTGAAGLRRAPDSPHTRAARGQRHHLCVLCVAVADPAPGGLQTAHPDIDIRVNADDRIADLDASEHDVALRYTARDVPPEHAELLFEEHLSPSSAPTTPPCEYGELPPLRRPLTLAPPHPDRGRRLPPQRGVLSWRHWLNQHGLASCSPSAGCASTSPTSRSRPPSPARPLPSATAHGPGAPDPGELIEPFPEGRLKPALMRTGSSHHLPRGQGRGAGVCGMGAGGRRLGCKVGERRSFAGWQRQNGRTSRKKADESSPRSLLVEAGVLRLHHVRSAQQGLLPCIAVFGERS